MTESTQVLASHSKRLGGALIDCLIMMAVSFPVMLVTGAFRQITEQRRMTFVQGAFYSLFGLAVFLCINGYFLAKQGQTVGKKIVGTRIVAYSDGQILPFGKLLCLRYLPIALIAMIRVIGQILILADILFIFRADKRCIHDLIAGTKVVDA